MIIANALLANVWLAKLDGLRLDLTRGQLYSMSPASLQLLDQLREPLLIRGYFSEKTHPMLSPLAPQLKDLISEYAVVGDGQVRVEFIDPELHPDLEQEAIQQFGINATPFQVADRHRSTLVNSFFNVLVQYGDEYETLGLPT